MVRGTSDRNRWGSPLFVIGVTRPLAPSRTDGGCTANGSSGLPSLSHQHPRASASGRAPLGELGPSSREPYPKNQHHFGVGSWPERWSRVHFSNASQNGCPPSGRISSLHRSGPKGQQSAGLRTPSAGYGAVSVRRPQASLGPRSTGPRTPPVAVRPGLVQRYGNGGAFAVEAGPLGLVKRRQSAGGGGARQDGGDPWRPFFLNVGVHIGPQAHRSAPIAFPIGSDIYFAPVRYQPESLQGQQLFGHDLAQVVQHRRGLARAPERHQAGHRARANAYRTGPRAGGRWSDTAQVAGTRVSGPSRSPGRRLAVDG